MLASLLFFIAVRRQKPPMAAPPHQRVSNWGASPMTVGSPGVGTGVRVCSPHHVLATSRTPCPTVEHLRGGIHGSSMVMLWMGLFWRPARAAGPKHGLGKKGLSWESRDTEPAASSRLGYLRSAPSACPPRSHQPQQHGDTGACTTTALRYQHTRGAAHCHHPLAHAAAPPRPAAERQRPPQPAPAAQEAAGGCLGALIGVAPAPGQENPPFP